MTSVLARILAIAMLLACGLAQAHKPSDSYLAIETKEAAFEGRWDIALRDLEEAIGLDADADGAITWGELRQARTRVEAYAAAGLALATVRGDCTWAWRDLAVDRHTDGAYASLAFAGSCPGAARDATVTYRLLFDIDAQHRGLLKASEGDAVRSMVLSRDNPAAVLSARQPSGGFASFVADGVKHIAIGIDHILFLVALLLPAVLVREGGSWKPTASLGRTLLNVAGIVTAFTLAHSLTLSAAALEWIRPPARWVESLIALSVLLTALDNLVPFLPRRRWIVAFAFGLLHGFGFASVLLDLGLPPQALALSLFGFNVGVEIGQLLLVLALVPLAHALRARPAYPRLAVGAGSIAIALAATGWTLERALDFRFMPF